VINNSAQISVAKELHSLTWLYIEPWVLVIFPIPAVEIRKNIQV